MKYFTVGPSQTHANFEKHLQQAIKRDIAKISHRSEYFKSMYAELCTRVKKLFNTPKDYETVFLGSATEFMERSIQNLSTRETLHVVHGNFAERAYIFAKTAGRIAHRVDARDDGSVSFNDFPASASPELIFLTHSETSVGAQLPKSFISAVRKRYPDALIAIDVVSSAPTCDVPIRDVDCVFFSIQKGIGLPAGLGVGLVSPRAHETAQRIFADGKYNGLFHSFPSLIKQGREGKTLETPNVLYMHLLNEYLGVLLKIGVKKLREASKKKAAVLYDALEHSSRVSPSIKDPRWRSETVIVARTAESSKAIIEMIKKKGLLIASGYNKDKDTKIRIANFPQHNLADITTIAKMLR